MVHGLETFRKHLQVFNDKYVLIGGTACDILMEDLGETFRATKDLDIVLIIEALDATFAQAFWDFIEEGGYTHRVKNEKSNQFYRFTNPRNPDFPKMVELFSRTPSNKDYNLAKGIIPIHVGSDISSLSAILLDDNYYGLLKDRKITVDGISILDLEGLIPFKIKAWLDLKEVKASGKHVDSKNIKKHKTDVFRLLANADPSTKVRTTRTIVDDINLFSKRVNVDRPDLKNLGLKNVNFEELMSVLHSKYVS